MPAILFVLAFVVRLWFNFGSDHPNAYASCDASEYLRYTNALSILFRDGINPASLAQLKEFVITGPSLPIFLLGANLLSGLAYDPTNSTIPLIAQSALSASTVAFVYLITNRLYEKNTALTAGGMAIFYPAFIVNSGRLYSETFAAFIECLALFLIVRGYFAFEPGRRLLNSFCLGAGLIVLQLSRSAMILLTAVSLPIVFLQAFLPWQQKNWRQALISAALLLIGAAAVLAPWFAFEKAAYNKISLVVDRVGHYNLFVGTNTRTQGFLSYPYPDGRGIEAQSFVSLIKQSYKASPSRFFKLALDKPARLFKAPWNDFRTAVGAVDYKWQVAYHQILLLLAVIGLAISCVVFKPEDEEEEKEEGEDSEKNASESSAISTINRAKIWGRLTLLLAFALQLPYLAFITVPRYNLTAMPILIIFAAAGLHALIYLNSKNPLAKTPKAILIAALALIIFLRDDLKDAFTIGQAQMATIYAVQGQDMLARGIIGTAFGIGLFVSLYLALDLLRGYKKVARVGTIILAAITVPLLAMPQRANGRPGENIITLARPGEAIVGTIKLPVAPEAKVALGNKAWYLLIDCADPTIFAKNLQLSVNGKALSGPFIPAISALDDWTYIKSAGANRSYVECAHIYDCLTQPTAITNLDLRQWFYLPLSEEAVAEARRRGSLDISIKQTSTTPTNLFAASTRDSSVLIPSRDLYSWEKCFYGVENDSGLTDSRYDEKVSKRAATWKINFGDSSEELTGLDLNLRLLCQPDIAAASSPAIEASGRGEAVLSLDGIVRLNVLTLLRAKLSHVRAGAKDSQKNKASNDPQILTSESLAASSPGAILANTPELSLEWLDQSGKKTTMRLPWLKNTPSTELDIAIPCDLSKINGSQIILKAVSKDPTILIDLSARPLKEHPIFGVGQLF